MNSLLTLSQRRNVPFLLAPRVPVQGHHLRPQRCAHIPFLPLEMPQELQDEAATAQAQVDQDASRASRQGDDRRLVAAGLAVRQEAQRPRQVRPESGGGDAQGNGARGGDSTETGESVHEETTCWEAGERQEESGGQTGCGRGRAPYSQGAPADGGGRAVGVSQECRNCRGQGATAAEEEEQVARWRRHRRRWRDGPGLIRLRECVSLLRSMGSLFMSKRMGSASAFW